MDVLTHASQIVGIVGVIATLSILVLVFRRTPKESQRILKPTQSSPTRNRLLPLALTGLIILLCSSILIVTGPPLFPNTAPAWFYRADWSSGLNGWQQTANIQWLNTDGGKISIKGAINQTLLAPFQPKGPDYTIETQLRRVDYEASGSHTFGVVTRKTDLGGALCGASTNLPGQKEHLFIGTLQSSLNGTSHIDPNKDIFVKSLDSDWHTYRIEASGNQLTLYLDGNLILTRADNEHTNPGRVGLYIDGAQIEVKSFQINANS